MQTKQTNDKTKISKKYLRCSPGWHSRLFFSEFPVPPAVRKTTDLETEMGETELGFYTHLTSWFPMRICNAAWVRYGTRKLEKRESDFSLNTALSATWSGKNRLAGQYLYRWWVHSYCILYSTAPVPCPMFFYVLYSTQLHLPPLRFHCVQGC